MKNTLLFALIFIFLGCTNQKSTKNNVEKETVEIKSEAVVTPYFGYLNQKKDSLLALPMDQVMEIPEKYDRLLVGDRIVSITFIDHKPEQDASNGRQTTQNFANNEGSLFKLQQAIPSGDFGLLINQAFLKNYEIQKFDQTNKESSAELVEKLTKKYNRKVQVSTTIAELKDKSQFNLTVFENEQDSALAVLSYLQNDEIYVLEFPAQYDEISTWRIDDGGVFDPQSFQILSILKSGSKISFVSVFWGAEGYDLNLYQPKNNIFQSTAQAYGYSAPL